MDIIHDKLSAFNYDAISAEGGEDMENKQLAFDLQDMSGETIIEEEQKETENTEFLQSLGTNARWIWEDPEILTADVKAAVEEMQPYNRPRFIVELIDKYFNKYPEFAEFEQVRIWQEPELLLELFRSLTLEELEENVLSENRKQKARAIFDRLQERLLEIDEFFDEYAGNDEDTRYANKHARIDPEDINEVWPIVTIRYNFTLSELRKLYYLKNPRESSKERAKKSGAIINTGGRLADISNTHYKGWLDEKPNKYAYLSYTGDTHFLESFATDEEGNILEFNKLRRIVSDQDQKARKASRSGAFTDSRPPEHERINKEIMQALLKVALDNEANKDKRYLTIHVPTFARELNTHFAAGLDEYEKNGELKDAAKAKRADILKAAAENKEYVAPNFLDLINDLNYWVGVLNDIPRQMVNIVSVDYKNNTIDIDLPYINYTIDAVREDAAEKAEKENKKYLNPAYNKLFHTKKIMGRKNARAVDLAYTIAGYILRRGTRNDTSTDPAQEETTTKEKNVTVNVKYSTLVKETPLLNMAYKQATTKRQYTILERAFKGAFKILREDTDIYKYYIDLNIPEIPPTTRTIEDVLVITHKGINPDYKLPK